VIYRAYISKSITAGAAWFGKKYGNIINTPGMANHTGCIDIKHISLIFDFLRQFMFECFKMIMMVIFYQKIIRSTK